MALCTENLSHNPFGCICASGRGLYYLETQNGQKCLSTLQAAGKEIFFDGLFLYTHLLTKAFPSSPTKGPSRPPPTQIIYGTGGVSRLEPGDEVMRMHAFWTAFLTVNPFCPRVPTQS